MTSQCTAQLLADLGVTRSLSRPQVSDDNPLFRGPVQNLEVPSPRFPDGSRDHEAKSRRSVDRSSAGTMPSTAMEASSMLTPEQVHFGNADQVIAGRKSVLREAWGRSSRTLRQRCTEAQTAPGGRLHQSSHPFPHHTGHCSLINPVECPIDIDRFR